MKRGSGETHTRSPLGPRLGPYSYRAVPYADGIQKKAGYWVLEQRAQSCRPDYGDVVAAYWYSTSPYS